MKRISVCSLLFIFSAAVTIFSSCKRDMPQVASVNNNTDTTALVQVFNGIANSARNKVYVDGNQVSGSVVSEGGVFPATAIAFSVSPGTRSITIKDTLATSTQQPLNFSQNFEKGKKYSVFTYDTITSPKQLVVVNNITTPADTTCRVRFANFLYKVPNVSNVDVYSYKMGMATPVFKNIAYAQVTDFMPYPTGSTDTIYVYPTGMTTSLIIKASVIVNAVQRNYTAVLNNSYSSTNKKSNLLSFFATY